MNKILRGGGIFLMIAFENQIKTKTQENESKIDNSKITNKFNVPRNKWVNDIYK